MRHDRSAPDAERPTPAGGDASAAALAPAAGAAVAVLGIAAMLSPVRLPGLAAGLGVRGTVALGTLLLATPAVLVLLALPAVRRAALGGPLRGRTARLCVLLAAALWVFSIGVVTLQALVRPPSPEELDLFRRLHAALAPKSPLDFLVSLAVIAVLPAICEELVMRGVLLTSLARWLGPTPAIFATAVVFAVIHDPLRLLFAFTLGVAFGYVRVWTGSLWPSVVVHATLNALTFVVAPLVDDPSQPYTPEPLLGAGALVAGLALSWPLLQRLRAARSSPA